MTSRFEPGDFVRITIGGYAGMTGVYCGETLTAWGRVYPGESGRWALVRLTANTLTVTVEPEQLRHEIRTSEQEATR